MRLHMTEGIVLKKEPYGEADAVFTFLTKDFGKIRTVARGVRKQEAKLRGHMEVFTHAAIGFILGKNFYRLTSAEMNNFFPALRADPIRVQKASHVVHILEQNVFEEAGDSRLFELACATFHALENRGSSCVPAVAVATSSFQEPLFSFHAKLLSILGLLPEGAVTGQLVEALMREHLGFNYAPFPAILELA